MKSISLSQIGPFATRKVDLCAIVLLPAVFLAFNLHYWLVTANVNVDFPEDD